jgi:hypothetical protein
MNEKKAKEQQWDKAPEGLGVAGSPPEPKNMDPQVVPSSNPPIFGDWFQIQGTTGSNLSLLIGKHLYDNNLIRECVTVVMPNELFQDLMGKLGTIYKPKEEK